MPDETPKSLGKKRKNLQRNKDFLLSDTSPHSPIGNENSARSFSDRSFFEPPWGRGRPRLRVMDVRTEMLVFPGFRGPDRSFCPRTSAGISARMSAGYPAPKLTLWAAFSFLTQNCRYRQNKTKQMQLGQLTPPSTPSFLGHFLRGREGQVQHLLVRSSVYVCSCVCVCVPPLSP